MTRPTAGKESPVDFITPALLNGVGVVAAPHTIGAAR